MQRWMILFALTLSRAAMAFQFQSIPALAVPIAAETGLSYGLIGLLTGLYLLPGAVTALLGGWAGQVLGDIRTALGGLALMVLGGLAGAYLAGVDVQRLKTYEDLSIHSPGNDDYFRVSFLHMI